MVEAANRSKTGVGRKEGADRESALRMVDTRLRAKRNALRGSGKEGATSGGRHTARGREIMISSGRGVESPLSGGKISGRPTQCIGIVGWHRILSHISTARTNKKQKEKTEE